MTYVSLYRKWRPQTFADVVAQSHVVRTLANALTEKRIAHAYLFTGPRGTGKTTVARLLAKGLNCVEGPTPEPCGQCESCQRITGGMAMDVVEIDGASNRGIDEMRDVRERVRFAPSEGPYKVYIIDEVHMLTNEAFNALLKVLEEPPAHVVFVFATTEPHRIPSTVTSRCQRFDFRRFSSADAVGRLQHVAEAENIDVTPEALALIARYADGSLRDGLGILDQARAYEDRVTAEVVTDVLGVASREQVESFAAVLAEADAARGLALVKELQGEGRNFRQFLRDVARYLRDVLLYAAAGEDALRGSLSSEQLTVIADYAGRISKDTLLRAIDVLGEAEGEMRFAAQSHLPLEMAVIRITNVAVASGEETAADNSVVAQLMQRIERLEAQVVQLQASGGTTPPPRTEASPPTAQPSAVPATPTEQPSATPAASAVDSPAARPTRDVPRSAPDTARLARDAARPAPPAESAAGDGALTAVLDQWDNLLDQLRQQRQVTIQAFLREGRPISFVGETLTIEFPEERSFHRASLAEPNHAKIVEDALRPLLGRPVKIETVMEGEFSPPASASSAGTPASSGTRVSPSSESVPRKSGGGNASEAGTWTAAPGSTAAPKSAAPASDVTPSDGPAGRETSSPAEAVSPQTDELPAGTGKSGPAQDAADPTQDPLVQDALRIFGGEIVEVEPADEGRGSGAGDGGV